MTLQQACAAMTPEKLQHYYDRRLVMRDNLEELTAPPIIMRLEDWVIDVVRTEMDRRGLSVE